MAARNSVVWLEGMSVGVCNKVEGITYAGLWGFGAGDARVRETSPDSKTRELEKSILNDLGVKTVMERN